MVYQLIKAYWENEEGMGTIEVILIVVVLIGLVLIFKNQLTSLLETILKQINSKAKRVYS